MSKKTKTKEKCFADLGKECYSLKEKQCNNCPFYKPVSEITIEELKKQYRK